jgi:ribosomal protein S18 acetylase RimI-like enzyme
VIRLRPFTTADLPAAQALTASFGWPHRLADWEFMAGVGSGVAAEAADGTLLGTAMAWPFGTAHGAIGLIGVAPAAQRQGLGRRLTAAALDLLSGRTVILHATEAGLPLYRSLGFVAGETVRQYQSASHEAGLMQLRPGWRLRPIGRNDAAALTALDRASTGLDRSVLMAALLEVSGGVVLDEGGAAVGFGLFRRFGRGTVVGPVVAPDVASGQAMIGHLIGLHAGEFVRVDVPEGTGLPAWLERIGLADAGPAIRMVRGPLAVPGPVVTCALASQALG